MKRVSAGLLFVLVAAGSGPAAAELGPRERSHQGIRYVCAGFGEEERADPRWDAYPLKLVFVTATGRYFADVVTTLRDADGKTIFHLHCDAPWLLLRLDPGRYEVTALALAHMDKQKARITLHEGRQTTHTIRFSTIED